MKNIYVIPLLFLSLLLACGSCKNKAQAQDEQFQNEPLEGSWTLIAHYGASDKMYDFHKGSVVWTFKDNRLNVVVNKWEYNRNDTDPGLDFPVLAHMIGTYRYTTKGDIMTIRDVKVAFEFQDIQINFEIKKDTLLIKTPSDGDRMLVSKFLKY